MYSMWNKSGHLMQKLTQTSGTYFERSMLCLELAINMNTIHSNIWPKLISSPPQIARVYYKPKQNFTQLNKYLETIVFLTGKVVTICKHINHALDIYFSPPKPQSCQWEPCFWKRIVATGLELNIIGQPNDNCWGYSNNVCNVCIWFPHVTKWLCVKFLLLVSC